jgi:hypothetical protein
MSQRRFPEDYLAWHKVVVLVILSPLLVFAFVVATGFWLALLLSAALHVAIGVAIHGAQPFTINAWLFAITSAALWPPCWYLSYKRGWFS